MFEHISTQQLADLKNKQAVNIVDIRDGQSFAAGHIPHATLLNNDNVAQFVASADKNTPLVVCCYHGNSSQGAAQYLSEQEFKQVYSLDGGFEVWKVSQPNDIEV
jgi:thiosulfate sulfurtransferase